SARNRRQGTHRASRSKVHSQCTVLSSLRQINDERAARSTASLPVDRYARLFCSAADLQFAGLDGMGIQSRIFAVLDVQTHRPVDGVLPRWSDLNRPVEGVELERAELLANRFG